MIGTRMRQERVGADRVKVVGLDEAEDNYGVEEVMP